MKKIREIKEQVKDTSFKIIQFGKDLKKAASFPNIGMKQKIFIAILAMSVSLLIRLLHHL